MLSEVEVRFDDTGLFGEFGVQEKEAPLQERAIEAALVAARARYGNSPWAEDRAGDAALEAVTRVMEHSPRPGVNDVYTLFNFTLAVSLGKAMSAGKEEVAEDSLVSLLSDLVPPGVADPEGYIEHLLDSNVVSSDALTDEDGQRAGRGFYVRGHYLTPRELARMIASGETGETLYQTIERAVLDEQLVSEIEQRLIQWQAENDGFVPLEVEPAPEEPESCPLIRTWITENGQTRMVLLDGRQEDGAYAVRENDEPLTWSIEEDERQHNGEASFGSDEEMAAFASRPAFENLHQAYLAIKEEPIGFGAHIYVGRGKKLIRRRLSKMSTIMSAYSYGKPEPPVPDRWGRMVIKNQHIIWAALTSSPVCSEVPANVSLKTPEPWFMKAFAAIDVAVGVLADLSELEAAQVLRMRYEDPEELAWALYATGVQQWSSEIEEAPISAQKAVDALMKEVLERRLFPSRAAVVIHQIRGRTPAEARGIGDRVMQRSQELRQQIGQKALTTQTEMLLADLEIPTFGVYAQGTPVGVIGIQKSDQVSKLVSRLSNPFIVCTGESRNGWYGLGDERWTEDQLLALVDKLIVPVGWKPRSAYARKRLPEVVVKYVKEV